MIYRHSDSFLLVLRSGLNDHINEIIKMYDVDRID